MMRVYRKWTDADGEIAQAMRAEGKTLRQIGDRLGRSPAGVQQYFAKLAGTFRRLGRTCSTCAAPINDANTSGHCKPCNTRAQNSDPTFTAKRVEALRSCPQLQVGAQTRVAAAKKAAVTRMANPEYVERLKVHMRTVVSPASRAPGVRDKIDFAAMGEKLRAHRLAWCPPEYWDEYIYLMRNKGIPAADARKMILEGIAAKKAKQAALSPFERQEQALARGAKLAANDKISATPVHHLLAERAA